MPFLHILLSKIKLHHVSELSVTCWVGCVCVGGVSSLVLCLCSVRRLISDRDRETEKGQQVRQVILGIHILATGSLELMNKKQESCRIT